MDSAIHYTLRSTGSCKLSPFLNGKKGSRTADKRLTHFICFPFSCSNIIEEHEEKLEAQQRPTPASKPGRKITNNNDISGLIGTDELEFSFGGPAKDIGKRFDIVFHMC